MEKTAVQQVTPDLILELSRRPVAWERIQRIHLIGIAGTGMGALAGLFKMKGFHVSGSDQNVYPPMSTFLEEQKIPVILGYEAEKLPANLDLVVVGNTCRKDHPQVLEAAKRGVTLRSFPACIGEYFMKEKESVVVCGTHGKTTTTAMVSWLLRSAKRDPSFLMGGVPVDLPTSMEMGNGKQFVIEGDEYDTAFYDKVPKFVHYRPHHVILTSIEFDHADIYDTFEKYLAAFHRLMTLIPKDGTLISWAGSQDVVNVSAQSKARVEFFAMQTDKTFTSKPPLWIGKILRADERGTTLEITKNGSPFVTFQTHLSGERNMGNWVAAVAVAASTGLKPEEIKVAAELFHGVRRRQEVSGVVHDCYVIDDFAHHPTAVDATLSALRGRFGKRRLWGIFEPRTQTSCRRIFQKDYTRAFGIADVVVIAKPFRELPKELCFQSDELVADLKSAGKDAHYGSDVPAILDIIQSRAKRGDVFVIMSNGAFDGIHQKLLACLKTLKL